jgi:hypothetical protein
MKEKLAPICLFTYNRLWHTQQTIAALLENDLASKSELIIFSDGAKTIQDQIKVDEVRRFIHSIKGFKTVSIIESPVNRGLADSIIYGVSTIVKKYGRIIVLEDDLVTFPFFLRYMNEALNMYENEENVASIHAYVYPIHNLPDTFFLKGADCWGWATWARAWEIFEPNGTKILKQIEQRKLEREVDFNNSTNYIKMLKGQIKGKNDSWAIRWHLSAFLKDKFTLYPGKSFIQNIGCDYSGQHSKATTIFDSIMCEKYEGLNKIQIKDNAEAYKKYELYYNENKKSIFIKGFRHFLNISRKHLLKTK